MTTNKKVLPTHHSQARRFLELIAISGELPADQASRIFTSESYQEAVITSLKEKRLIRTYYKDRLRGYRLTAAAKKLLLENNDERFNFYLVGDVDTNRLKSEITRRLRLHRIAETHITMQNAGVSVFQDEKPDVFYPSDCEAELPVIDSSAFYNSREIKEVGTDFVKIRGARTVGTLLTESKAYIVYNTGSFLMKWEYKSEMRTKALMKTLLCRERMPEQYTPDDIQGIVFGADMDVAFLLLTSTGGVKHNYFLLDGNYDHFYFLTSDHKGEILLKLLCDSERTTELNHILSENLKERDAGLVIENDAIDENGNPVLFAYSFDMPRITRFTSALQIYGKNGVLICFDFQADILRRYCGEQVTIQTIDFVKCERRFL